MSSEVIYQRVRQITCANCQQVINVAMQKPFTQIDCPHCRAKLNVPAMLGPFMLLEVLGTGGMGAVYRAMDQSLGRFVAIKVMKKQLGDDHKLVESFLREARAAAALNHANIVQIYSCGEQSGQPYIAMELVSGGRLDLLMEGGKVLDETRLLQTSLDVANGLSAANDVNLVHGDIKPANILYDRHGVAKIVDFGLAQFVNRSQEKGEIWGTPYYISPERARGGKADHRSDIYSLGATMFHALTGKPPFDGPTASDVVVARLKQPVPDILELRPDLTRQTAELITRMMATDPTVRYPTSASLLADVKAALAASKSNTGKTKSATGKIAPVAGAAAVEAGARGKSKAPLIIGLVAVVAAAVGFAVWKAGKKQPPAPQPEFPIVVPGPGATPPGKAPAVPEAAAAGEPFFKGAEETALIAAMQSLASQPQTMIANLDAFAAASSIPKASGRSLWIRNIQGLGRRMLADEGGALELWSSVTSVRITSEESPNFLPKNLSRVMLLDMPVEQFEKWKQTRPAWYQQLAGVFRATELILKQKYTDARPLLDQYLAGSGTNPAWPYGLQPAVKSWLEKIDKFRAEASPAKSRGDHNAVKSSWDNAKKDLPALLQKLDPMAIMADIGPGSPAASAAAVEADKKTVQQAFEAEKSNSMVRRDYTAAADNLVALNQKLSTREGRELLANVVNQLDRMDAVKNMIINGAKTQPFKQRTDLGGDLTSADANGFKVGNTGKKWSEISNPTMAQIAAWYVNNGSADNKKKADDLASIAVFCAVNGNTADAKKYASEARGKDGGVSGVLQKLAPGI